MLATCAQVCLGLGMTTDSPILVIEFSQLSIIFIGKSTLRSNVHNQVCFFPFIFRQCDRLLRCSSFNREIEYGCGITFGERCAVRKQETNENSNNQKQKHHVPKQTRLSTTPSRTCWFLHYTGNLL